MANYGPDIKAERARLGLNQEQVATAVGIHRATLTNIENGDIGIDDETRDRILAAIALDTDQAAA